MLFVYIQVGKSIFDSYSLFSNLVLRILNLYLNSFSYFINNTFDNTQFLPLLILTVQSCMKPILGQR